MAKVLGCGLAISEFELLSRFYVHFRTNTLGKGMKPVIPLAIGLIASRLFSYKDDFDYK